MTSSVSIPTGQTVYLHFKHAFGFEDDSSGGVYDGGILEYSTNSGGTWQDANALGFTHNGYNGTISSSYGNPLGGRRGFHGQEQRVYLQSCEPEHTRRPERPPAFSHRHRQRLR